MKTTLSVSICVAFWGFFTGVERAIIIPTLYLYLNQSFTTNSAESYYAPTIAAFNLSILLFSPIYGLIAYKGFRTKPLIIVSCFLEIFGNVVYLMARQPWMVLIGRLVAGMGAGIGTPLTADIVRVTNHDQRMFYICLMYVTIQVGLIIGPTATIGFSKINFNIGWLQVNVYNIPGLQMSVLWFIYIVLILFLYPCLTKQGQIAHIPTDAKTSVCRRIKFKVYENPEKSTYYERLTDEHDCEPGVAIENGHVHVNNNGSDRDVSNSNNNGININSDGGSPRKRKISAMSRLRNIRHNYSSYTTYPIVTLLVVCFSGYFSLMALETVLPPVAVTYFKWDEVQLSYLYFGCGIMIVIVYGIIFAIPNLKNRTLLGCGLVTCFVSYLWLTFVCGYINSKQYTLYVILEIVGIFFHIVGLTGLVAGGQSMYSKIIPKEDADRGQTISNTIANFALLVGPYIGGALSSYPYVVFIIMLSLIALCNVLFFNRLDSFIY